MKKIPIIIAIFVLIFSSVDLFGFGRRNHATVAYIAEQHLSNKARKEIAKIIGGESLMEGAVYADEKRLDIRIRLEEGEFLRYDGRIGLKGPDGKPFTYGAFYFEEEDGSVWATIPHGWGAENDGTYYPVKKGECVWGTEYYTEMLRNRKNLTPEEVKLALYMVVHLIGDIHCPSHIHFKDARDYSDMKITVTYKGKPIRYHNIWDTNILVDTYIGGPVDFGYYCDPMLNGSLPKSEAKRRMKEIQSGSLYDWAKDVATYITPIFEPPYKVEPDTEITKEQLMLFAPIGREMVLRAGYRLAAWLNEIFE